MKFLHAVVLLFLLSLQGGQVVAATGLPNLWAQQYGNLQSKDFGLLSVFWAQAMIGAPEGHRYLAELERTGFAFYQTGIGIFEESISLDPALLRARVAPELLTVLEKEVAEHEAMLGNTAAWHTEDYAEIIEAWQRRKLGMGRGGEHATAVANLLNGESPVGISRQGMIVAEVELVYDDDDGDEPIYVHLASNTQDKLEIINLSVAFPRAHAAREFLACAATNNDMLFVTAAGNDFPTPMYGGLEKTSLITVGSCAPTGYFSHFSRAGQHLTISAPSDDYILSIAAGTGELRVFGGTSGAAPLVSGALADVISIIPDLMPDEATHMLQRTAIPTSINTLQEGRGVLNYYKLLRVAAKIHHTATGDTQKIRQLIYDDAMYDFSDETRQLQDSELAADTEQAFFNLRAAFFLDPNDTETRRLLAEMYRQAGYEAEALFYDDPAVSQQQARVQAFVKYRRLLADMAEIEIYHADNSGFTEKFRGYIASALRNPQKPELLEVLLRRLSLAQLQAAGYSGDLAQDLQADPAELAMEKLHLFNVLKRHQQRLASQR